ncbi:MULTISPECIES: hypothetical protein [Kitasatospora]|nr:MULTISPECIES: hypothetical protein [Kitasatospora]
MNAAGALPATRTRPAATRTRPAAAGARSGRRPGCAQRSFAAAPSLESAA